ncbi:MAG TPA: M48 family metalloprotease, partial [Bacteroidia bacterium]
MLTIQLLCQIKHENKYFNFARKGYKKYTYGLPRQIRFKVYIHRNLPVNCFFSKPLCCLLLASLLFNLKILCQNSSGNYKPERDYAVPENVIKEYQYQFHNWKDQVEFSNNKAKASFIEILSNHSAELQSMNAAGLLMHGDSLTRSINQIKNNILSHNPSLANKRFELFMERTEEPNACNSGEGIVFFTTGLLVKFTSVDEVAFVISHEIAHDVLNHLRKEMVQTCEAENNSAFKKKLKKTSTIAYGRNTEYEHLWTALFYKEMEDSRRNELQADSLGFIFYKNSGYNIQAATETMSALDAADYDLYPDTLDLKRFFNFKDYPFKSYWMKQDRP